MWELIIHAPYSAILSAVLIHKAIHGFPYSRVTLRLYPGTPGLHCAVTDTVVASSRRKSDACLNPL